MIKVLYFFLAILSIPPAFAAPTWLTGTYPKLVGQDLQVVCHGDGPDRATAFLAAMNECRSMASESILQNFSVKNLTVQTEFDNATHDEIQSNSIVTGLKCDVKDSYEESSNRWLLCSFDTSHARVSRDSMPKQIPPKSILTDPENNYLILSIVPGWDSILVKSSTPRIIRDQKNPVAVTIRPGDEEIIIRLRGYAPHHIRAADWQNQRMLSVFLDRY